jgi:hypothetical protein
MINKIKKLAESPVFSSDTDIENFVRIMGLSSTELLILKNSRDIIKQYYLTKKTNLENEHIIDKALVLINGQKTNDSKSYSIDQKEIVVTETKIKQGKLDNKIIEALQNPYQSLEKFIKDSFLYASPVYAIAVHFANNHLENEDSVEESRRKIEILSNKYTLEKLIMDSEKQVLNWFVSTIQSTRKDLEKIIGKDIKNIFSYNDNTITYLKQEMLKYRNYMIPKMNEMHAYSEKLKNFWIQNEENTGQLMQTFIKGGALGATAAALFGPLGVLAAAGASYFSENENEKKKEAMYDSLFNNWAATYDSFYFTQLKEYYKVYYNLFSKIAKLYISNYQLAYKFSNSHGKKYEFEQYIKKEIIDTVSNNEFIKMQQEISELSEFINNKGE